MKIEICENTASMVAHIVGLICAAIAFTTYCYFMAKG